MTSAHREYWKVSCGHPRHDVPKLAVAFRPGDVLAVWSS
jgi:hypothetical protein